MKRQALFSCAMFVFLCLTGTAVWGVDLGDGAVFRLPPIDNDDLLTEDSLTAGPGVAPRFALPVEVKIDPFTYGSWTTLNDGSMHWRLVVSSPEAKSLNFGFTRYMMPLGGELRIHSLDKEQAIRPFTAADNKPHGQLWTPLLPTAEAVLELRVSAEGYRSLELELTHIGHGYRTFGDVQESGSCNVDVICPEGDDWRDEIRSVAVISTGGSTFCTGFMVNNTAQDLRPLFMTADHCGIAGSAPSLVVFWNYENSTCRVPGSGASGGGGDGSLAQFQTGSTLLATSSPSDFTLVVLDDAPDEVWNVHWAGWDRSGNDFPSSVGIHHPSTDEKRISIDNDPTSTTSYLGSSVPGDGTHIRVLDWDLGTTEGGSSGSPLFNPAHRAIGQLHGGNAACGNDTEDWYGHIAVSWEGGGTAGNRLRDHLDPAGTGTMFIDGRDASAIGVAPKQVDVCAPDDALFALTVAQIGGSSSSVTLSATGQPAGTTTAFSANPVVPPATSTLTISNTGAAAAGSYAIDINGTSSGGTEMDSATLRVFSGVPLAPGLTAPVNGALNQPARPTLSWTPPAGGSDYTVEIALDAAFTNVVVSQTVGETTFLPAADLATNTLHYWRVLAANICGAGGTSSVRTFTTQAAPGDCSTGTTAVVAFADDMEGGAPGWVHGGSGDTWHLSATRTHGGSNSYLAIGVSSVSDQLLDSPAISLPATGSALSLQFWNYQEIEDSFSGCFDSGVLEISTDGATWTRLEAELQTDPYDGAVGGGSSNPLAGSNGWCADPQDWFRSVVDLSAWAGQTVRFRFRLGTDSSVSREGWYIDDVVVQSCEVGASEIFSDGFESGGTSMWSTVSP